MKNRGLMLSLRVGLVLLLLATASGMAGCAPGPTPTPQPTPTPRPTSKPTASPTPGAIDLVVLHTNDVLSYTEPCG